jgi:hypothetical protein
MQGIYEHIPKKHVSGYILLQLFSIMLHVMLFLLLLLLLVHIKRDLQEVGGDCGNWMERAQDRDRWRTLVNTVMNFRVP